MSLRQPQVPAAFEIRFSTTDSRLEIFEIQPDNKSKEVPDPFKKRDKIPRSSGSIEQFTDISNSNSNNNSNNSNSNSSNNNATAPIRHSSVDSQTRSRHHPDQVSSPKVKSSNSVGPEADKQLQRLSGGKNLNIEKTNLLVNDVNTSEDDSIIRNAQSSNKKQRSSSKADEFTGEKEKSNLGKVVITPNHQSMDLNGKTEMVISNNKKIMPKTILKSKKTRTSTNNENKPIPKDGIATPPDTPPISPASTPARSSQTRSENDVTDQMTLEETHLATPLVTPPLSINSNDDVSTQSSSRVTLAPKSRKRRGSHSSQFSSEMPAAKLQIPRSRRSSLASKPTVTVEQSQESSLTQLLNKSKEMQMSQQSQQNPPRSRIPRLSMSSKERPIIAKKESQESLSQGSNKIDESKESLSSSYPETPRGLRLATSRPIINTSFVTDIEVTSESPTSYLPTGQSSPISPTSDSPTSHSPTDHLTNQRKLTISHDDIIVPTVAKKLKMHGQLPVVNYDALLGYSEEPEIITPTTESGYMDITDQVVDLFDNPKSKPHKKKSDPNSQRRQQSVRKNSHSRNSSKTHYIAPRKQNQPAQQVNEDPTITRFERSSNRSTLNDDRKSRREEYIMVIHDDNDIEFIESHTSVPSVPSEQFTAPAVQVENNDQVYNDKVYNDQVHNDQVYNDQAYNDQVYNDQAYNDQVYNDQVYNDQTYQEKIEKIVEPAPQVPVVQEPWHNPIPAEEPIATSGKIKKDKKKKQKKESSYSYDDDDIDVRKSTCLCRCSIM